MPRFRQDKLTEIGIPAVFCAVVVLLLPILRYPAMILSAILGVAAFVIVPAACFGAALALGLRSDAVNGDRTVKHAAAGFAIGAFLVTLVGSSSELGFFGASVTGAIGGFALALQTCQETKARLLVAGASAVGFSIVTLLVATTSVTCTTGG